MATPNNAGLMRRRRNADVSLEPSSDRAPNLSALNRKKPEWAQKVEVWTDLHLLSAGGWELKNHAERFLRMRPKEDGAVYAARLQQATYQDLLGTGLGWYASELFETDPAIKACQEQTSGKLVDAPEGKTLFYDRKFLKNCDRAGNSFTNFWRDLMLQMMTYGEVWALTDLPRQPKPDDPNAPKSLQDQLDGGYLDPYVVGYSPMNVINYQEDEFGQLQWCVVQVTTEVQRFLEGPQIVDRWYYFDKTTYRIYEKIRDKDEDKKKTKDADLLANVIKAAGGSPKKNDDPPIPLVEEGLHALAEFERCPVRRYKLPEHLWMANRAYLPLLDHFNQDNTLSWALFMANLAVPVIIGDVDVSNMLMSEIGFIVLPDGCEYRWTEPEGKSFSVSQQRANQLREEIFRSMYLVALGRNASSTAAAQSGFSKQMEMESSSDILDALGSVVIQGMQQMLNDVADARGDDDLIFDVRGFNFELKISLQEIDVIERIIAINVPSPTFEKQMYNAIVRSFLKDANPEVMPQIQREIQEGPTRLELDIEMMKFQAGLGMKPLVYDRIRGTKADGMLISMAGSPGSPASGSEQQPPKKGGKSNTYQAAAGSARGGSNKQKGPTTRPGKAN